MRWISCLILAACLPLLVTGPVRAQQAEAKEAARDSNCPPGKVEVLKRISGRFSETIYKIVCTGQKSADGAETFVVIQCRDRTCVAMR